MTLNITHKTFQNVNRFFAYFFLTLGFAFAISLAYNFMILFAFWFLGITLYIPVTAYLPASLEFGYRSLFIRCLELGTSGKQ